MSPFQAISYFKVSLTFQEVSGTEVTFLIITADVQLTSFNEDIKLNGLLNVLNSWNEKSKKVNFQVNF